ncbi:MAG TPA: DUF302 domain-containing protein [Methylophaga aminisulfidivorans]|uniref:DUF302 domain-containing protein n=1 Tax=Methylophaga aminisulfidivorans TaxID=230105 RepID=A0A7C1VSK6_9GAMM|nr:DUF302 domain-containing protein [Methylophaga aminisulfidivorans]
MKYCHTFIILWTLLFITSCQQEQQRIYEKVSPYSYEDTLLNLDIAISEFNYRIIHRSHIGQAIRDRGDADFPLSTITNFCNITYAKEMMQINPQLINDMPCNISVQEGEQGQIIISTKLMNIQVDDPAEKRFATKINTTLKKVIEAAIE